MIFFLSLLPKLILFISAKSGGCSHNKNSHCLVLVVEEEGFPIQLQ